MTLHELAETLNDNTMIETWIKSSKKTSKYRRMALKGYRRNKRHKEIMAYDVVKIELGDFAIFDNGWRSVPGMTVTLTP